MYPTTHTEITSPSPTVTTLNTQVIFMPCQITAGILYAKISTGGIINKSTGWVLQFDPSSLSILHDFIFNNIPYVSKE